MKAMNDPDYIYQPWDEKRRRSAALRARRQHLGKTKAKGFKALFRALIQEAFNAGYTQGLDDASESLNSFSLRRKSRKQKTK